MLDFTNLCYNVPDFNIAFEYISFYFFNSMLMINQQNLVGFRISMVWNLKKMLECLNLRQFTVLSKKY